MHINPPLFAVHKVGNKTKNRPVLHPNLIYNVNRAPAHATAAIKQDPHHFFQPAGILQASNSTQGYLLHLFSLFSEQGLLCFVQVSHDKQ